MILKPIATEKAVKLIDIENTMVFETERRANKTQIKKEIESLFNVKVSKVRTTITANRKFAYVRFDKKNPAIDLATKLGMI